MKDIPGPYEHVRLQFRTSWFQEKHRVKFWVNRYVEDPIENQNAFAYIGMGYNYDKHIQCTSLINYMFNSADCSFAEVFDASKKVPTQPMFLCYKISS